MRNPSNLPQGEYLDILPLGVMVLAQDYTVVSWNRTIAEWTGISSEEMLGQDIRERFPHLKDRRYTLRIQQVLEGGPAALFSTQFHPHFIDAPLPGGGLRFQRTSVHPILAGGKGYAILFIDDVTELVSQVHAYREMKDRAFAEVEERTKKEAALALANKKINLLSSITRHDILNQIMALRCYIEILREEKDPGVISDFINKEELVVNLIEEQTNFARDYQEMGVHAPEWQDVSAVVERVASTLPMHNIRIIVESNAIEIYADPLLEKVFHNLIDNALRYGGPAMTTIRISSKEIPAGLVVSFEDDGAGIEPKDKEHLFKRGYGKHTGLGLFLCSEILSITGIGIKETSDPGKGARFEMLVPPGKYRDKKTI